MRILRPDKARRARKGWTPVFSACSAVRRPAKLRQERHGCRAGLIGEPTRSVGAAWFGGLRDRQPRSPGLMPLLWSLADARGLRSFYKHGAPDGASALNGRRRAGGFSLLEIMVAV